MTGDELRYGPELAAIVEAVRAEAERQFGAVECRYDSSRDDYFSRLVITARADHPEDLPSAVVKELLGAVAVRLSAKQRLDVVEVDS